MGPDMPSLLPHDPLFGVIAARVLEAAADRIDKEWKTMNDSGSQGYWCSPHHAIDVLQAEVQRLRAERRWIPVEERLPPLMTEVVGWHPSDQVRAWFRHSGTVQGGPKQGTYWEQWSPQDRECDDCDVDAPTHWMPMPNPPELKP